MSENNQDNSLNKEQFYDLYNEKSEEQKTYNSINVYGQPEDKNSESI